MNYEERYNQALERAKKVHDGELTISPNEVNDFNVYEYIFPELKESEDERIRTLLISSVKNETPIASEHNKELAIAWLEKQGETEDEDDTDFTIYHPLKNGSGKYECIPYSFYGSLTSFSEDEDLINFLRNCFYTEKECKEWIEKQGEQNTIVNESPSKEMILAVWELGNIWKELTKGSSCTEYGTQLQYIQKHWNESGYYEKLQGEQKPIDKVEPKFHKGDWVVCNDANVYQVKEIDYTNIIPRYELENIDGDKLSIPFTSDYNLRNWAIEDAKDGDVLSQDGIPFIFKSWDNNCIAYCGITGFGLFKVVKDYFSWCNGINVTPATKEQRDTLERAMTNAGYRWNKEELKLEKI